MSSVFSSFALFRRPKILAAVFLSAAVSTVSLESAASQWLMPMTAVPRGGDASCFVDDGGSLKNVCKTTKMVSFMSNIDAVDQEVEALVYSRDTADFALVCQAVAMSSDQTSWTVGPQMYYEPSKQFLDLRGDNAVFVAGGRTYSVDCWVPAGAHLGSVHIFGF